MVAHAKRQPAGEPLLTEARERAARLREGIRDEAKVLKRQALEKTEELTRTVKQQADRILNDRKSRAAEQVERIGSVMHQAAQVLERGEIAKVAEYVDMAALGTKAASKYLEDREVGEIADDMADLVRRHPMVTFGAMMIAGLAVARFVKAGQSERQGAERARQRADGRRNHR